MQEYTSQDIQDRATEALMQTAEQMTIPGPPVGLFPRELLRQQIADEMKEKIDSGEVVITTDEEMRLLREFRVFKSSCKPGGVFKWQTRPTSEGAFLPATDTGLIRSPENVTE